MDLHGRVILVLCLLSCSPRGDYEEYASAFARAFISESVGKAPDALSSLTLPSFVSAYHGLMDEWDYVPDPPDLDTIAGAEDLFRRGDLRGDCEDFAAALASLCQCLNLTCRLALGETRGTGHAWLEVRISDEALDPRETQVLVNLFRNQRPVGHLGSAFRSTARILSRPDGVWLQMSPPESLDDSKRSLDDYRVTHFIETSGKLITL